MIFLHFVEGGAKIEKHVVRGPKMKITLRGLNAVTFFKKKWKSITAYIVTTHRFHCFWLVLA